MQKYILVKLLEAVPMGSEFSAATWPLHLTLVDDFFADLDETAIYQRLQQLLASRPPAITIATQDDLLGPLQTVPVTLLDVTPGLLSLHNAVVDLLTEAGAVLVSPAFAGHGYKPHVTIQGDSRVNIGDKIVVDALSIVAMSPDGKTHLKLVSTATG